MKRFFIAIAILAALGGGSSLALATNHQTVGDKVDDAAITTKVKAKLTADRLKNLWAIEVETVDGVVHLKGNVPTAADKAEAERVARQTSGVRSVRNELRVQAAGTRDTGTPAASPATMGYIGRHTMTGEVMDVDTDGRVKIRTAEGNLHLHFPPDAVKNVKRGDRITVELALRPER
jgi:hyperosmotically inducible protein